MSSHESSIGMGSAIVGTVVVVVVGVVAGMVKIPTYFANREVQEALNTTVKEVKPSDDDDTVLNAINTHLMEAKASQYTVVDNQQREHQGLNLSSDDVTIERDGNRSIDIDVTYTQQMWVPILDKIDDQTFHAHAHADNPAS